jgi:hypothetical protein
MSYKEVFCFSANLPARNPRTLLDEDAFFLDVGWRTRSR